MRKSSSHWVGKGLDPEEQVRTRQACKPFRKSLREGLFPQMERIKEREKKKSEQAGDSSYWRTLKEDEHPSITVGTGGL